MDNEIYKTGMFCLEDLGAGPPAPLPPLSTPLTIFWTS